MQLKKMMQAMACAAVLAVAAPTVPANAQATPTPTAMANETEGAIKAAVDKLKLTPDQKAKLKPMFDEARTKIAAVKGDATLTPDQKKAKYHEIGAALHTNVDTILTPEQQTSLTGDLASIKSKHKM